MAADTDQGGAGSVRSNNFMKTSLDNPESNEVVQKKRSHSVHRVNLQLTQVMFSALVNEMDEPMRTKLIFDFKSILSPEQLV